MYKISVTTSTKKLYNNCLPLQFLNFLTVASVPWLEPVPKNLLVNPKHCCHPMLLRGK